MTWTSAEVKARLREAADADRRSRMAGLRPAGFGGSWPQTLQTPEDEWALMLARLADGSYADAERDASRCRPPGPSGRELDRMAEAFEWLELIEDITCRRIVLAWAYRIKWRMIAAKAGLSKRTAQRVFAYGVATIAVSLSRRRPQPRHVGRPRTR